MHFGHVPFLPFLDSPSSIPSATQLDALATIAPLLVPLSALSQLVSRLPPHAERYVYDDLEGPTGPRLDSIISALDLGAAKVVTDIGSQLVQLGVPSERIIHKHPIPSSEQNLDESSQLVLILDHQLNQSNELLTDFLTKNKPKHATLLLDPAMSFKSALPSVPISNNLVCVIGVQELNDADLDRLIDLFLSRLHTDRPDGLFSTSVVSLSPSSTLLGQVYSSADSLRLSIKTRKATYFSRSRNQLWLKGETSGATQELVRLRSDCDGDSVEFQVVQRTNTGFCHTNEISCFGPLGGLTRLESTLLQRQQSATPGSYTNRLFTDEKLLKAKIMEEAEELCHAEAHADVQGEMADLLYFALCRCISKGVSLADVEQKLNERSLKVTRRKGDAKPKWEAQLNGEPSGQSTNSAPGITPQASQAPLAKAESAHSGNHQQMLRCRTVVLAQVPMQVRPSLLKRPMVDSQIMVGRVRPIIDMVKEGGDAGLLSAVHQYDKCNLSSPPSLIIKSPFPAELSRVAPDVQEAIDVAYRNVYAFHIKQLDKERSPMVVETMQGVVCSRFARPIDRVGLYVPGGTAVLPSTALMLAIPAQVAGCPHISIATPPRADGTISPEIMYIAAMCGVKEIVKAGGAHAVAALAYGTQSVTKVDKIFGPGNQFVTVAKMLVASDLQAGTAIDMPAGPSEVLVIADTSCNPIFVAADLLSQAEHGPDSQVILVSIDIPDELLSEIEFQINAQAQRLPRLSIIQESIPKSFIVRVASLEEAFEVSNEYAPEHLILHLAQANKHLDKVRNAGSVFIGAYSPESCGDYASGTNHSLPTVGFAKQYSGVSTLAYMKHITSQELTPEGLKNLGPTVIRLAELEGLDGHANAVRARLETC